MRLRLQPAIEEAEPAMNQQDPPQVDPPAPQSPPVNERSHGQEPRYLYMPWADSDESKKLWRKSRGDEWHWVETLTAGGLAAALCVILALTLGPIAGGVPDGWAIPVRAIQVFLLGVAFFLSAGLVARYSAARRSYYERVRSAKSQWVDQAVNDLLEHHDLPHLMVLNRRQLDDYHMSSVRQQSIAFRNAQIAGVAGFVILVAGAAVSIQQSTQTAQLVAGGLAALGGALSAYVVKVFARSYDRASSEMRVYYLEPFYTHQVLMVERVAGLRAAPQDEDVVDGELRAAIVTRLLNVLKPLELTGSSSPGNSAKRTDSAPKDA